MKTDKTKMKWCVLQPVSRDEYAVGRQGRSHRQCEVQKKEEKKTNERKKNMNADKKELGNKEGERERERMEKRVRERKMEQKIYKREKDVRRSGSASCLHARVPVYHSQNGRRP